MGYMGRVGATLRYYNQKHMNCQRWQRSVSESEALTGFYTVQVVSPNLALLGAEYSFELEGTLGA